MNTEEKYSNVMNVLYEHNEFYALFNFIQLIYMNKNITKDITRSYLEYLLSCIEDNENFKDLEENVFDFAKEHEIGLHSIYKDQLFLRSIERKLCVLRKVYGDVSINRKCDEIMYEISEYIKELREEICNDR